jgi:hypothetical protein
LRRTGLYVSLLGISVALYLSVFEQPANRVFFRTLPITLVEDIQKQRYGKANMC